MSGTRMKARRGIAHASQAREEFARATSMDPGGRQAIVDEAGAMTMHERRGTEGIRKGLLRDTPEGLA